MAVQVKWFPTLAKRTRSQQAQAELGWRPGLTPASIISEEGFSATDAEAIMAVVNGTQVKPDQPLQDGDRLEFLVSIQGG
jgi:sulfur carrier protein ThiS